MIAKAITKTKPAFPFEAYCHVVSPIDAADGGGFMFTMPASASGKVLARLPRSMHMQLAARAKTEGVSLNSLVLAFIAEGLGRRSAVRT